jgi:hypothetical protein
MVGEYVHSNAHNSSLTPEFAIFFCFSYFGAQKASVAPKVFAIRQVIQIDELACSSSPITRAKRVWKILPPSFRLLNMEEGRTLLVRGEETTITQVVRHQIFVS